MQDAPPKGQNRLIVLPVEQLLAFAINPSYKINIIVNTEQVTVTPAPSLDYTLTPLSGDQYTSCLCGNERKTLSWTMAPSALGKGSSLEVPRLRTTVPLSPTKPLFISMELLRSSRVMKCFDTFYRILQDLKLKLIKFHIVLVDMF